jgi:MoxR-like ATPase
MMSNGKQANTIGRSIGGPVCGLKLIPLSRPGGPEEKTLQHFASKCDSFGKEVTFNEEAKTAKIAYDVALPDPAAEKPEDWRAEAATSCASCANYVPPMATRKLTGWSGGYCRAKGQILLDDRLHLYAQSCEDRKFQPRTKRVSDTDPRTSQGITILMFPEYDPNFGKPKPVDINEIHRNNIATAPNMYPTDAAINEKHVKMGIRAFRRVRDPKGYGPSIMIPIMDESYFSKEDAERIPHSGDPEKPEKYFDHNGAVYKVAVMWTKLNQTPALWGEPGVGKTELFRHIAWMMGMPFQRISITESSEVDDMIGKMMFTPDKGTFFQYGRIPRGWTRPNILCLDEPNTGQPALWQQIRPLTDDSKQMVIDQNNSEALLKHRLCYLGMAMNPAWDPRNTGVAPLADADGSRLMHINMTLPPEHIEKQILVEVLEEDRWATAEAVPLVDTIMRIAKEIRMIGKEGGHLPSWGIRNQKKVVRLKRYMSWPDAFRMGVTDSLEPEVADAILAVVNSHAGDE